MDRTTSDHFDLMAKGILVKRRKKVLSKINVSCFLYNQIIVQRLCAEHERLRIRISFARKLFVQNPNIEFEHKKFVTPKFLVNVYLN